MKALREGYLLGTLDKHIRERSVEIEGAIKTSTRKKIEREEKNDNEFTLRQSADAKAGWEAFELLSEEEQSALKQKFCKLSTSAMIARRLGVDTAVLGERLAEPAAWISFGCFVVNHLHKAAKVFK